MFCVVLYNSGSNRFPLQNLWRNDFFLIFGLKFRLYAQTTGIVKIYCFAGHSRIWHCWWRSYRPYQFSLHIEIWFLPLIFKLNMLFSESKWNSVFTLAYFEMGHRIFKQCKFFLLEIFCCFYRFVWMEFFLVFEGFMEIENVLIVALMVKRD